nr:DNA primase [Sphingomonas panni]
MSPAFLDDVRSRTSLSALVARTVKLQRVGNEHKACCPFHTEKTPSFWVNDDKAFYHCFGCGAHGDAIRWMTDQRGLPFLDAVRELAAAAGLDMPAGDDRDHDQANALRDVGEAAAAWFAARFDDVEGRDARAALDARGIRPDTARAFGIGFAPDARGRLKAALGKHGVPALVASGMLVSVEGKEPYDRFRGRLMIPIRDARGRTIAFGGRVLGAGEPKYLNSPETPLFDKGRALFNIDRAQVAARKVGRVVVVEGYLDVIALAQAGIAEVVAPLGTALTDDQLRLLWRMADVPILCFDGDAAGRKAARRAAERALPLLTPGKSVAIAALAAGMDPDDMVRAQGAAAFERVLSTRESLADFLCRSAFDQLAGGDTGPDRRAQCQAELLRLADTIADPIIRREYARTFRDRCWQRFAPARRAQPVVTRPDPAAALHRAVLVGLTLYPDVLAQHVETVQALPFAGDLADWRDALVDAAVLGEPAPPPRQPATLPFRYCRPGDADGAADLAATIALLDRTAASDRAIAQAQSAAIDGDADAVAQLQRLHGDRRALIEPWTAE